MGFGKERSSSVSRFLSSFIFILDDRYQCSTLFKESLINGGLSSLYNETARARSEMKGEIVILFFFFASVCLYLEKPDANAF